MQDVWREIKQGLGSHRVYDPVVRMGVEKLALLLETVLEKYRIKF